MYSRYRVQLVLANGQLITMVLEAQSIFQAQQIVESAHQGCTVVMVTPI